MAKRNERVGALSNIGRGSAGNPPHRLGHDPLVSDRGYGNGY